MYSPSLILYLSFTILFFASSQCVYSIRTNFEFYICSRKIDSQRFLSRKKASALSLRARRTHLRRRVCRIFLVQKSLPQIFLLHYENSKLDQLYKFSFLSQPSLYRIFLWKSWVLPTDSPLPCFENKSKYAIMLPGGGRNVCNHWNSKRKYSFYK